MCCSLSRVKARDDSLILKRQGITHTTTAVFSIYYSLAGAGGIKMPDYYIH